VRAGHLRERARWSRKNRIWRALPRRHRAHQDQHAVSSPGAGLRYWPPWRGAPFTRFQTCCMIISAVLATAQAVSRTKSSGAVRRRSPARKPPQTYAASGQPRDAESDIRQGLAVEPVSFDGATQPAKAPPSWPTTPISGGVAHMFEKGSSGATAKQPALPCQAAAGVPARQAGCHRGRPAIAVSIAPASWRKPEQLYRRILEVERRNFDCLHLLGVLHFQRANFPRRSVRSTTPSRSVRTWPMPQQSRQCLRS